MNDVLSGRLASQYVTAAYLFLDTDSRLFRYSGAGHPPMLRLDRCERHVREVEQNGVILGFLEYQEYKELEGPLHGRDRFLLYTDGFIEAANAADDFFGLERLKVILGGEGALGADPLAETLLTTVEQWTGRAMGDDVTLIVADWADTTISREERSCDTFMQP